ncbi:hypothetical protein B0H16DRAFT_1478971 [Mycena metata]|uniref:Uncharacterized protein n=1 Tax=Mycena metata TaxID=1033252 RepID=A0AAD7ME87_9AGAR|nr:hypothetical protein B0H16DRAFT_1478971 [Mycena metata]
MIERSGKVVERNQRKPSVRSESRNARYGAAAPPEWDTQALLGRGSSITPRREGCEAGAANKLYELRAPGPPASTMHRVPKYPIHSGGPRGTRTRPYRAAAEFHGEEGVRAGPYKRGGDALLFEASDDEGLRVPSAPGERVTQSPEPERKYRMRESRARTPVKQRMRRNHVDAKNDPRRRVGWWCTTSSYSQGDSGERGFKWRGRWA